MRWNQVIHRNNDRSLFPPQLKFQNVRRGNSEYFKNGFNQRIIDIQQKFSKELQLTYQALKKK